MVPWRLALLVTLYVAMDVANPLMPGALVFDPDASVEARQAARFMATDDATPPTRTPAWTGLHALAPVSACLATVPPRPPRRCVAHASLPLRAPDPSDEEADAPSARPALI